MSADLHWSIIELLVALLPKGATELAKEAKWPRPTGCSRRDFLARTLYWAPGALLSAPLWKRRFGSGQTSRADAGGGGYLADPQDYRVTPHYRLRPPLEDVIRKVEPSLDTFIGEKHAEEIEDVLAKWTAALLQSPAGVDAIGTSLSPDLEGSSLQPVEHVPLRPWAGLEVHRRALRLCRRGS